MSVIVKSYIFTIVGVATLLLLVQISNAYQCLIPLASLKNDEKRRGGDLNSRGAKHHELAVGTTPGSRLTWLGHLGN